MEFFKVMCEKTQNYCYITLEKTGKKIIILLEIPLTYLLENIFKEGAVYGKKR